MLKKALCYVVCITYTQTYLKIVGMQVSAIKKKKTTQKHSKTHKTQKCIHAENHDFSSDQGHVTEN